MLFNSLEFLLFLLLVFLIYWKLQRRNQNILLLIASYIFYSWWDWRFLGLIILSSVIDFFVGKKLFAGTSERKRKMYLAISVCANLGILAFFKYFNFFIDSVTTALGAIGLSSSLTTLHIILPVGISFYTFQTMSYAIEIYRKKIQPTNDIISFFTFVSFFPQLVAGPIERASALLGQFNEKRRFSYSEATDGLKQILWGLFKKIVIADNMSEVVEMIYSSPDLFSGAHLSVATVFFAFQIYCDFSGYSDIAIGTSKLFGIRLSKNFNYPYFSRNISEFWKRWHITLSEWFRDNVYIPLGGSRTKSKWVHLRNLVITFTLSGLWHGAEWNFVLWGLFHGLFYIPYIFSSAIKRKTKREKPVSYSDIPAILVTFLFVTLAWIFFRAETLGDALFILQRVVQDSVLSDPLVFFDRLYIKKTVLILGLIAFEWIQRTKDHPLRLSLPRWARMSLYYLIIVAILLLGNFNYQPFIYFQF